MGETENTSQVPTEEVLFDLLDRLPNIRIIEDHSDYVSQFSILYPEPETRVERVDLGEMEISINRRIINDITIKPLKETLNGLAIRITHQIQGQPLITEIDFKQQEGVTIRRYVDTDEMKVLVGEKKDFDPLSLKILKITQGAIDIVDYYRLLTRRNGPSSSNYIFHNNMPIRRILDVLPGTVPVNPFCYILGQLKPKISRVLEQDIP